MQLTVSDVAKYLNISEKIVYQWIRQNKLPAFKINEQYRLNRAEVLEWATDQGINVSSDIFGYPEKDKTTILGLTNALKAGGIHFQVGGKDKNSVLKSAIDLMPLPKEMDKAFLLQVFMARESLGSTGIGDGIAIPHVRKPIVTHISQPIVTLCFLEHAIEFGSVDGRPVHTIFTMISPTISAHLNLLSRLTFALRQSVFAGVIARKASYEEILEVASMIDSSVRCHNGVFPKEEADI